MRMEPAGNIEQGITAVLNAFHSLYDSMQGDDRFEFDWYGTAETATILTIRNARHHNLANRIRGIYNFHLQQKTPEIPKTYFYINYPETEDGGSTFDVPISWYDFQVLLKMPNSQNKLRPSATSAVFSYLDGKKIDMYATSGDTDIEDIFFNLTPLIVNAAREIVPVIKPHIQARSIEAQTFLVHFESVFPADTHSHLVDRLSIFLPS